MIAVDTNIINKILRGENMETPDEVLYVPFAVIAEIRSGVLSGNNPPKYKQVVQEFFDGEDVILSSGLLPEVIDNYSEIYAYLKKTGRPISPNDLWIAAECMNLSLSLLTHDKDFDHVPQILKA